MKKTLIIITHPDIEHSIINKRWIEELEKFPEKFHIHQLHKVYPDQKFDIAAEQKLVEEHDHIIFQFPYYWYYAPALLKKWLDEVLTHGWAYGSSSGFKFGGKKVALAISLGLKEEHLQRGTPLKFNLEDLTHPYEAMFDWIKADYQPFFAYYGMTFEPSDEWVERSVPLYLDFLDRFNPENQDIMVAQLSNEKD